VHIRASSSNDTAATTSISFFLCPSETNTTPGSTNHAGNNGIRFPGFQRLVFFESSQVVQISAITDGLGSAVAVSEIVQGPNDWRGRDPLGSVFSLSIPYTGNKGADLLLSSCRSLNPSLGPVSTNLKGKAWIREAFPYTLYNHFDTVDQLSCVNDGFVQEGSYTAGSKHTGVNILLADGHAGFISATVSPVIWAALGSRNGGETVTFPTDK
jgi:prepilin-type processing-associated H-X9-DG protein